MTMTTDATVIATSIVTFISGFMLGVYSIRGYLLVSPELADERRRNLHDPVESDESDVDEGDTVLDHAPNWANGIDADRRDGLRVPPDDTPSGGGEGETKKKKSKKAAAEEANPVVADVAAGAGGNSNEECKLVLVVRTDLGMTKAAQCSHATLACYKTLSRSASSSSPSASASSSLLRRWERHGQAKIAVQTKSEDEMLELMGRARSLGITAEVIQDAGRTQIDPGSLTVLGVGPAPKSLVDQVTGHLKLL
ncbi:hypothetical protein DL770_003633 [Monosporascus sp. CRB-9-2]|nr:hypothetical protein DL770_003633 [Monosporascus sp. CRB-9-2]